MPVVILEISSADGSLLSRGHYILFYMVVIIESKYTRTETVD